MWETCGFSPEAPPCNLPRNPPSLSESNVSPSARRPRVPTKASLSEHSDLSARDRMEGHAQAPRHADTLPAVPPGWVLGASQVVPAPRQSLRRRDGVRTKGNTLGLTSCRPPCGDGCVRPPVPRASARGRGGDSGVWKGALKGGQRPHNRPLSPARRAQGERHGKKGRKRKNAGCSRKEQGSGESPTPVEMGGYLAAVSKHSEPTAGYIKA